MTKMPGRRRKKSSAYRKAPLIFTESPVNEQKNPPSPLYSARHPLTADSVTVGSQFNLTWVSPQFQDSTQTGGRRSRRNKSASSMVTRARQTQASVSVNSKRFLSKGYAPLKLLGDESVTPPPSRELTPLRLSQHDSDELRLNIFDNSDSDENVRNKAANEPNYVSESDVEFQLMPQNSANFHDFENRAEIERRLHGSDTNNRTPVRRSIRLKERYHRALRLMGTYMSSDDDSNVVNSHAYISEEILAPDTPESEYGRSKYSRKRYDIFVKNAKASLRKSHTEQKSINR